MSTRTLHPLAEEYLDRLDRAADHLPRARRRELVDDIEAHLVEALGHDPSDAEVLTVLDRLGEPEEIAAAEQPRAEPAPDPRGLHEWAAIILLLLGGFVFGIGWIAGLILLWSSRAWNTRDKLIGTLFWPGGLVVAFYASMLYLLGSAEACSGIAGEPLQCEGGGGSVVPLVALVLALVVPFATAFYLARRAGRAR
jgi:hypothetical protein